MTPCDSELKRTTNFEKSGRPLLQPVVPSGTNGGYCMIFVHVPSGATWRQKRGTRNEKLSCPCPHIGGFSEGTTGKNRDDLAKCGARGTPLGRRCEWGQRFASIAQSEHAGKEVRRIAHSGPLWAGKSWNKMIKFRGSKRRPFPAANAESASSGMKRKVDFARW